MNWRRMSYGIVGLATGILWVQPFTIQAAHAEEKTSPRFQFTLVTEPTDAKVQIHELTQPYASPVTLPEGRYHISVTAPGYKGEHGTVEIKGKDWSGLVRLTPVPSATAPEASQSAIDGAWEKIRKEQNMLKEERTKLEEKAGQLAKEKEKLAQAMAKLDLDAKELATRCKEPQPAVNPTASTSAKPSPAAPAAPVTPKVPASDPTASAKPSPATPAPTTVATAAPVTPKVPASDPPASPKPSPATPAPAAAATAAPVASSPAPAATASVSTAISPDSTPVPVLSVAGAGNNVAGASNNMEVKEGVQRILTHLQDAPAQQKVNAAAMKTLIKNLVATAPNDAEVQRVKQLYDERYLLYVGTFSSESKADDLENRLRALALPSFRQQFQIQGQKMVRVCVGLFAQRQEAVNALNAIQREFNVQDVIIRKFNK
ncbi:MAG: SPOR domain-containing protein [Magnetococcales bacterium]|nr:SPOR domain-containing protein [Magnetococcales bacterium]